jgi:hypothetical protein
MRYNLYVVLSIIVVSIALMGVDSALTRPVSPGFAAASSLNNALQYREAASSSIPLGIRSVYNQDAISEERPNIEGIFRSVVALTDGRNSTFDLNIGGKTYPIIFQISGIGNDIKSITAEKDNATLLLDIASRSDGKLRIDLPREVIDSKLQGNQDDPYAVFEDGQYIPADEIKNNPQTRRLIMDFEKGTGQIEIVGSRIVPEFGPITLLILIGCILGSIFLLKIKRANFLPSSRSS